jgi:hypothetical protein
VEVDVEVTVIVFTTVGVEVPIEVVEVVGVLVEVPAVVAVPVLAGMPVVVEVRVAVVATLPVAEAVAVAVAVTVRLITPTGAGSAVAASGGLPKPTPALSVQAGPSALKKTTTPIDKACCVLVTVVPSGRQTDASAVPTRLVQNRVLTKAESTSRAWYAPNHGVAVAIASRPAGRSWTLADTECAHRAWNAYVQARRASDVPKRPVADVLIGAFACRYQGLITRNPVDFRRCFPKLKLRQA